MTPSPAALLRTEHDSLHAPAVVGRPSRQEALEAVRTLIRWAGDDPTREGLLETPDRVLRAYREFYAGYQEEAADHLRKTFSEIEGYDDFVLVRDIDVLAHCEHHMVPFTGVAHVAYLPGTRVVGLSKIARVVETFSRRLQIQERLTVQIAEALQEALGARGVAVIVEATHHCMTMRGIKKKDAVTVTRHATGLLRSSTTLRAELDRLLSSERS